MPSAVTGSRTRTGIARIEATAATPSTPAIAARASAGSLSGSIDATSRSAPPRRARRRSESTVLWSSTWIATAIAIPRPMPAIGSARRRGLDAELLETTKDVRRIEVRAFQRGARVELAVFQEEDAVAGGRVARVVRDEEDRRPEVP